MYKYILTLLYLQFKGTVSRDFLLLVFYESVSPQPQSISLKRFEFFRKFAEVLASQGAPPVSTTPAENFATSSLCAVDTGGKFATGVNDTGGKQICRRCQRRRWQVATGIKDTGGKFATGVVDTGGKY
jgi:hypothetical protein